MSTTDFGSGPKLDDEFDFIIDQSGDIATNEPGTDLDELQKDVAFNIAREVDDDIGRQLTIGSREDIAMQISRTIEADPRINDVTSLSVKQDAGDRYKLVASVDTSTADGPFDLVIPV